MNDDPTTASSAARLPSPHDSINENDNDANSSDAVEVGEGSSSQQQHPTRRTARNGPLRSSSCMRRAKSGVAKKLEFVTHLMSSLDVLVFSELCVIYYMDCSFARLVIRSVVQYMYLTPKPEDFLRLMPTPRPQIYTICTSNIICVLLHLLVALPEASETMRGYLHGGVIIDFIGQKAPSSKISLCLLDCLVLLLQCVMCAVWLEKDRLKNMAITLRSVDAGGLPARAAGMLAPQSLTDGAPASIQDLDAEERGVWRDHALGSDETNDIEMRPLANEQPPLTNSEDGGGDGPLEARYNHVLTSLGRSSSQEERPDRPSSLDVMMSGNGLLANFHVVHSVRILGDQSISDTNASAYPLRLTGYTTTLATLATQSQARL